MNVFRKKRVAAFVLLVLTIVLFVNSEWLAKTIYPIKYRDEIERSAQKYGVDPFLVAAVIRAESNYKPEPRSHKGAIGLMQVMPDTADWMFRKEKDFKGYSLKDLDDPAKNIAVGTRYLAYLNNQFQFSQAVVIAAYNAGEGKVARWRESGVWNGELDTADRIPFSETRKYVDRVDYYYRKYVKIYAGDRP